ncbi:hypothetical protein DFH09DRAFT_934682, partial [Mycena vulgaris]
TIELLRLNTPGAVFASFGVDTPTVSFSRDTSCSVRLYYPAVAPVHARIVFSDARKAFLEVLGAQGLRLDGCVVYLHADADKTKTIALRNGGELETHGKRFRLPYPAKGCAPRSRRPLPVRIPRPHMLGVPLTLLPFLSPPHLGPANRALRLSMIASAQVFSP